MPQAGTTGRARETRVPASRCTWVALIFASGSTVHVHEFTCAFRHRRVRRTSGGTRGERGALRSSERVAFSPPHPISPHSNPGVAWRGEARRGEARRRSSHEVNEKSSGLRRPCRGLCAKYPARKPPFFFFFFVGYRFSQKLLLSR